jgi:uncharacterized protein
MRSESLCAYCRKHPLAVEWRPFCCERCKLADLGHWLSGDYRVPGDPPPEANPDGTADHDVDE